MATAETPDIRGTSRTELIRRLAVGDETHEQLGVAFDRSAQTISNFASRNKDEIRLARQALVADPNDEYAGVAIAKKLNRIADADQDLQYVIELLESGDLSPTQRKGYLNLKSKLRREVAEERGELPVRGALELNVRGNPFANIDAVEIDDDGNLHPVR